MYIFDITCADRERCWLENLATRNEPRKETKAIAASCITSATDLGAVALQAAVFQGLGGAVTGPIGYSDTATS